jgi:uncharacterized membrane protein YhiD involved in acid resistance
MNEILQINNYNLVSTATVVEIIFTLLLSLFFSIIIAKVYMVVHEGYSYSKSYLHTMIMVSVTVALIMVIIGSDIARAFALVGAMSIIRFRNPVKDPRDVAFLFMTIAIGMACGVGFYMYATIFTVICVLLMVSLHHFNFGDLHLKSYIIKIKLPVGQKEMAIKEFEAFCSSVHILSVDHFSEDKSIEEVVFEIELNKGQDYNNLIDKLRQEVDFISINLLVGESNINA